MKIKDMLKLSYFKDSIIHTNIKGQESNIIQSISVMEYPIETFVRENEVVLSTCIYCDDIKIFEELVKDLKKSNATALVISTGCYITQIPSKIISLAEQIKLPIISIPWEIPFSNIVEEMYQKLESEQLLFSKKFEEIRDKLILMYLERVPLYDVVLFINNVLGYNIAILNHNYELVTKDSKEVLEKKEFVNGYTFFYIIQGKSKLYAYLLMNMEEEISINNIPKLNELVETNIINPLMLWFERENEFKVGEYKKQEKFLLNMIDDKENNKISLINKGRILGVELAEHYIVLVGLVDNTTLTEMTKDEYGINELKDAFSNVALYASLKYIIAFRKPYLIAFIEDRDLSYSDIEKFILEVEKLVIVSYKNLKINWGISDIHDKDIGIYHAYMDAMTNLKLGIKYRDEHIHSKEAILGYELFNEMVKNRIIMENVSKIMNELTTEDSNELLVTLHKYFENGRNISKTAEKMYLHRQSLIYRLKKIESLTGMSLDKPRDLFTLELSVYLTLFSEIAY